MLCKHIALQTLAKRFVTNALCFKELGPCIHQSLQVHYLQNCNDLLGTRPSLADCFLQPCRGYAKKLSFSYSGDLTRRKPIDIHAPVYNFKNPIKSLDQVPEVVQRLSSLEYADGRAKKYHRLEEMYDRVEHLFGSNADLEQRVAKLTVEIRNLIPHCMRYKQDKLVKSQLVEKIQMRKKLLKYLRREDYQRFMWILRELRIRYIPTPEYHGRVTQKFRKKRAVVRAAFDVRREKLIELRQRLDNERVKFEEYKAKTLAQIDEDIEALNLDCAFIEKQQTRRVMTKLEAKMFHLKRRTSP